MPQAALLLAGLTILGCQRLDLDSRPRNGYARKAEKVCILVRMDRSVDRVFFEPLGRRLQERFQARHIIAALVVLDPVDKADAATDLPGREDLQARVGFAPSFVLDGVVIGRRLSHGLTTDGKGRFTGVGVQQAGTFRWTLREAGTGLHAWVALQNLTWGDQGHQRIGVHPSSSEEAQGTPICADPVTCADQLIERLAADGLL